MSSQPVQVSTAAGFSTEVRAGSHTWMADEPVALGGADSGPTPYDLLLGALGACTTMTLRMYADRKALPLERIEVNLTHGREYQTDCEDCGENGRRIDVITREIRLFGPLDEAQRARLIEIANKCPVHRTLQGPLEVRTSLAS